MPDLRSGVASAIQRLDRGGSHSQPAADQLAAHKIYSGRRRPPQSFESPSTQQGQVLSLTAISAENGVNARHAKSRSCSPAPKQAKHDCFQKMHACWGARTQKHLPKGEPSRGNNITGTTKSLRTFATPFFLLQDDEPYCSTALLLQQGRSITFLLLVCSQAPEP